MSSPIQFGAGAKAAAGLRVLDWHGEVRNATHLDLALAWEIRDGIAVLVITERNEPNAAGLIIPKHLDRVLQ